MKIINYLTLAACALLCSLSAKAEVQGGGEDANEWEERENQYQEALSSSKGKDTGFVRIWNFTDSATAPFAVFIKPKDGEPTSVVLRCLPGSMTSYKSVPSGNFEIMVTEQAVPELTLESLNEPPQELPDPSRLRSLLSKALDVELKKDDCFTLVIQGSLDALQASLVEDLNVIDEDADGQIVPSLTFINFVSDAPVDLGWFKDGKTEWFKPNLTEQSYRTVLSNVNEFRVLTVKHTNENGRDASQHVFIDYKFGKTYSVVFYPGKYGRPKLSVAESGLRPALVDNY